MPEFVVIRVEYGDSITDPVEADTAGEAIRKACNGSSEIGQEYLVIPADQVQSLRGGTASYNRTKGAWE